MPLSGRPSRRVRYHYQAIRAQAFLVSGAESVSSPRRTLPPPDSVPIRRVFQIRWLSVRSASGLRLLPVIRLTRKLLTRSLNFEAEILNFWDLFRICDPGITKYRISLYTWIWLLLFSGYILLLFGILLFIYWLFFHGRVQPCKKVLFHANVTFLAFKCRFLRIQFIPFHISELRFLSRKVGCFRNSRATLVSNWLKEVQGWIIQLHKLIEIVWYIILNNIYRWIKSIISRYLLLSLILKWWREQLKLKQHTFIRNRNMWYYMIIVDNYNFISESLLKSLRT